MPYTATITHQMTHPYLANFATPWWTTPVEGVAQLGALRMALPATPEFAGSSYRTVPVQHTVPLIDHGAHFVMAGPQTVARVARALPQTPLGSTHATLNNKLRLALGVSTTATAVSRTPSTTARTLLDRTVEHMLRVSSHTRQSGIPVSALKSTRILTRAHNPKLPAPGLPFATKSAVNLSTPGTKVSASHPVTTVGPNTTAHTRPLNKETGLQPAPTEHVPSPPASSREPQVFTLINPAGPDRPDAAPLAMAQPVPVHQAPPINASSLPSLLAAIAHNAVLLANTQPLRLDTTNTTVTDSPPFQQVTLDTRVNQQVTLDNRVNQQVTLDNRVDPRVDPDAHVISLQNALYHLADFIKSAPARLNAIEVLALAPVFETLGLQTEFKIFTRDLLVFSPHKSISLKQLADFVFKSVINRRLSGSVTDAPPAESFDASLLRGLWLTTTREPDLDTSEQFGAIKIDGPGDGSFADPDGGGNEGQHSYQN
ncbi:MAG: hypothetical protein HQM16_05405 [Deltaproteobacteria bacterium]|nr:hypothetical protein [Deltaproteobacteria bacterium]